MQNIFLIMKMSCIGFFSSLIIIGSVIGGNVDINTKPNKFDLNVTKASIDGKDITKSAVYKNKITFSTKELQKKGDSSVLDYEITNNSKYDASITMECVKKGKKSDYYTIHETTPEIIKAGKTEKASLNIILIKESLTDSTEEFSCTLNATALEK